ncbi:Putative mycotoxin biosynthesis protein UstYa [Colletotrichum destructivum]|uniref:Mycotoxin biosynthesis protein UstYa n=1 Tax=Colletotrichum destructivum TaxID=34406 RepID=A0AAX4IKX0_9PEZI|nr:Putative mycotoxin biosynthesis protein UstYa [Colletotrichum destructivum]
MALSAKVSYHPLNNIATRNDINGNETCIDDDDDDAGDGSCCDCDCHHGRRTLERRLLACTILCCALAACTLAACALALDVKSYLRLSQPVIPLGVDPWGLVPQEVGQPASWRSFYNDSRDPYWMDEDTFDSPDVVRRVVRRLKWLQNSTNIRANGRQTRYRDWDGREDALPSYHGSTPTEVFGIRSFHQIHCIIVMVEDYGLRLHGEPSQWTPGHVMHCINTMRQLTQCMADATPISLVQGAEKHLGDGQQMWCRDFDGLRRWANAPERGLRYAIVSPPGAKDVYDEIWPYPGDLGPPADLW